MNQHFTKQQVTLAKIDYKKVDDGQRSLFAKVHGIGRYECASLWTS